jgi:hypothetical protein
MENLLKTTKDHEQFLFWVTTLQAGVLPKGTGSLQTATGYCCLGVGILCTTKVAKTGTLDDAMPNENNTTPVWLRKISDYCEERFNVTLTEKNDLPHREGGWSHKKIGTWLLNKYKKGLI